jgi:hypothetical protein
MVDLGVIRSMLSEYPVKYQEIANYLKSCNLDNKKQEYLMVFDYLVSIVKQTGFDYYEGSLDSVSKGYQDYEDRDRSDEDDGNRSSFIHLSKYIEDYNERIVAGQINSEIVIVDHNERANLRYKHKENYRGIIVGFDISQLFFRGKNSGFVKVERNFRNKTIQEMTKVGNLTFMKSPDEIEESIMEYFSFGVKEYKDWKLCFMNKPPRHSRDAVALLKNYDNYKNKIKVPARLFFKEDVLFSPFLFPVVDNDYNKEMFEYLKENAFFESSQVVKYFEESNLLQNRSGNNFYELPNAHVHLDIKTMAIVFVRGLINGVVNYNMSMPNLFDFYSQEDLGYKIIDLINNKELHGDDAREMIVWSENKRIKSSLSNQGSDSSIYLTSDSMPPMFIPKNANMDLHFGLIYYEDGNTFGRSWGNVCCIGAYGDEETAQRALEHIQVESSRDKHLKDKKTNINVGSLNFLNYYHIDLPASGRPWEGYFEHLDRTEIKSVNVKKASKDVKFNPYKPYSQPIQGMMNPCMEITDTNRVNLNEKEKEEE